MATQQKTKQRLLATAEAMAHGLYDANIINATTLREFNALCLPPVKEFSPSQIKRLRLREKISQAVFAKLLNTSPSTIQKWERGEKTPNGISLKLLNIVNSKGLKVLL
ncbi:MAG: helix-turn-helix domain-containing protein [Legionellales bacterium]|nr:helix-turn-helix domain-containing protein [Legionellales bacterium]